MAKKAKFEKLQVSSLRRGEIQYDTAYNARDAAKIAAKRARNGWSVKVSAASSGVAFMTCEPSTKPDPYEPHPRRKVWAKCRMTPAFKKRVRLR